jgi:hypothetical protein
MPNRIHRLAIAASTTVALAGLTASSPAQADLAPDAAQRSTVKTIVEPYVVDTKKRVLLVANVYAEADITLHGTVKFKVTRNSTGKTVYTGAVDAERGATGIPIAQVIDVVSKKNFKPDVVYRVYMTYDARFGHLEKDAKTVTQKFSYED